VSPSGKIPTLSRKQEGRANKDRWMAAISLLGKAKEKPAERFASCGPDLKSIYLVI
jgi:hypothetical protein